jgi:Flp pilus assembly protein TadD
VTLVITVATQQCVYQCTDYRLLDLRTGAVRDFDRQKIFFLQKQGWSATVCHAGIGRTTSVNVREWLAERALSIRHDAPFELLLDELGKADEWIWEDPLVDHKQSFSIAAFVAGKPEFALLSNFEDPEGEELLSLSPRLRLYREHPVQPTVYVSGHAAAVPPPVRRRLETFARGNPKHQSMFTALAHANREAAVLSELISPSCFTAYVNQQGHGGGRAQHAGARQAPVQSDGLAGNAEAAHRVVEFTSARAEPNDDYHRAQISARPDDPDVYANFGAFLSNVKQDAIGAEVAYRRALELDPNHSNALGNLANLVAARGDRVGAEELYRRALKNPGIGHENSSFNFAKFLVNESHDRTYALDILQQGIWANPDSARLQLLYAEQLLLAGRLSESLNEFEEARRKGADPARLESAYACAVHMSGAPLAECVTAYRRAIALAPADGSLRLNLAQLLFLEGDATQANSQLNDALQLGLDSSAQLEAQLYLLCHTDSDPNTVARQVKSLLQSGARLNWDVDKNIALLRSHDPHRAALAKAFVDVMVSARNPWQLDRAISHYSG